MRQKRNYRYEYMNKTTPLSSRLKKKSNGICLGNKSKIFITMNRNDPILCVVECYANRNRIILTLGL